MLWNCGVAQADTAASLGLTLGLGLKGNLTKKGEVRPRLAPAFCARVCGGGGRWGAAST